MSEKPLQAGQPSAILPTETLTPELLTTAGDILSKSMLFALRRNFLDAPVFANQIFRVVETPTPTSPELAFLEIEQVGKPVSDDVGEYFQAIQTTLASCHDPRYSLVFVVSSDGVRNRLLLGVNPRVGGTQPLLFAQQLGEFLSSNWPGTKIRPVGDYKYVVDHVHVPLSTYRYARAFTGIPSAKAARSGRDYPQSLDRLMRGLRGKPYLYLVIAEPMPEAEVDSLVASCRTLTGQVQAFAKTTVQKSLSESASDSISRSESDSTSTATSRGTTTSEAATKSKGAIGAMLDQSSGAMKGLKAVGVGGISALLAATGGPFLLSSMLGMFGQLLPSSSASSTTGESLSETETSGRTTGTTSTDGTTRGESMTFGREYLNRHADACTKLLEQTAERFETARSQGCWNVGVYLVSDQGEVAAQAQAQLRALVSGETSFEPVRAHDLGAVWDGPVQVALDAFQQPPLRLAQPGGTEPLHHPMGRAFETLSTPLNTKELSLLINLPLREMPGMPMQEVAQFGLNPPRSSGTGPSMELGKLLDGGWEVGDLAYPVDLDTLTRHVFVTGITGSGKSNTCRRIIESMLKAGINFMVIEPAKDEYVQLALAYNQAGTFDRKIAVYAPGRAEWGGLKLDPLRLNPFEIVRLPGAMVQVMPHLDRLKSIFNASFPMYEILPVILEEALVDLYDSQGWLEDQLPPLDVGGPTLSHLHARITALVRAKGYEERITSNIVAALKTRISSLMRGWKGQLFDHPDSTPWPDLFDRPVVINLQQMGDDADKCFTMALLLNFLYEYRQAQHEAAGSPESSALRHLAIFEEAHRVLRAASSGTREGNPQAKMGEMFADILAEIRAYGQGLAIVDQVPSKLVPDSLKNTNLKIVHRLVSMDDRHAMASALALDEDQARVISRLKVGQAIVCGVQDDLASWVRIHPTPLPSLSPAKKPQRE